ncbi:MAG: alpha/beta fold hydrolase [Magnetococcales bacterium]|nr:alpha/beta fold hydrolase [Magnetococcales bacterium]
MGLNAFESWWLAFVPFFIYGAGTLFLYLFQEWRIFRPTKGLRGDPGDWGMPFETLRLERDGITLHGWMIPGRLQGPVVLFFHGNTGNLTDFQAHIKLFQRLGLGVLAFDYRGYGLSGGKPSEAGLYADARTALQHLVHERALHPRNILYYGHSLGGGPALNLAMEHPPGGLILEGCFTGIADLAGELHPYFPVRALTRVHFNNLQRIPDLSSPLLVIHSRQDEVIPFHHGEKLFAAATSPKTLLESDGNHHDGFAASGPFAEAHLEAFVASCFSRNDR